jgi:predicted nucleic acid-binding protein
VTRTYRILIGVVVIGAAAAAYWMLLLSPKRQEAADLETKVSVSQAQLAQTRTTLADYESAKSKYQANYAQLVRLGKAVPADDDTRSLVVQVDAAAKRSGVGFDNIDLVAGASAAPAGSNVATAKSTTGLPPGAVDGGGFAVMPFSLAFVGQFGTLSNFFTRIERFVSVDGDKIAVDGRLLRIEKITLTPADTGWPNIQANIAASAYVVPNGTDAAAGATPQSPAPTTPGGPATTTGTTTTTPPTSTSDLR